ncbi:hypothetical protein NL676_034993 [Syzygium grande]|nr:hypothetical protein NL676_034993 [Syzygium grande]
MTAIEEMAARASRTENQDAIDTAIVGMLADPKEARAGIREAHFLPFNPVDKRTALTYIDLDESWHRASKGAPEQILNLCNCKEDVRKKAHAMIDKFAERGLRSLAVARQFVGLLPLFNPPRHDGAETIRRALNLGVNVKMITGDQLAIAKENGRRLGLGTNMYPSSSLLGQHKDASIAALPVDELIEKADGFAGVFPEHKYEIVKKLQERKNICGIECHNKCCADQPGYIPKNKELHDLCSLHHNPYCVWLYVHCFDLEVRLCAFYGFDHCHLKRWNNHDNLQRSSEAISPDR